VNPHTEDNDLTLAGTVLTGAEFSHSVKGRDYLTSKLEIKRLSGCDDIVNVIIPGDIPGICLFKKGARAAISGEARSHNNRTGVGSRLLIFAYVRNIQPAGRQEDSNQIRLTGTVCKPPIYRTTPLGREICDLLMAVRRRYDRSDYLPVILWGKNARAAAMLQQGDRIAVEGRLQSRDYIKETGGASVVKTAIEISVSGMEVL